VHVGGPPGPGLRNTVLYSDLYEPTEAHVGWFTVIGVDLLAVQLHMEGKKHRFPQSLKGYSTAFSY